MDDKKAIEELIAMYELEPTLSDIYVEGETDKAIVEWFLNRQRLQGINVYAIDVVEVPDTITNKYGLTTHSNRSRVVALGNELHSHFADSIRVLCVVDRDFEDIQPTVQPNPLLCLTDGNSIETYAFNERCLRKFISVVLGGFPLSTVDLMTCLDHTLREVYAIRLANQRLAWGMEWVPFTRYISIVGSRVGFNEEAFIMACLLKNGKSRSKADFTEMVTKCMSQLPRDCTRSIRGHDLPEMLLHLIKKLRRERKFGDAETVEGALLGVIETNDLCASELFQRITAIVAPNDIR